MLCKSVERSIEFTAEHEFVLNEKSLKVPNIAIGEINTYELIIVGGGPAGMTAAVYAARKLLNTLLTTSDIGGQVNWTNSVENYMGYQIIESDELVSKFQQQVNQFHIDQKIGQKVTQIKKTDRGFDILFESGE